MSINVLDEVPVLMLFATAFVVGQELGSIICEVVRVQGKWFVLKFDEPCNSFLSPFEAESDVLVDDRPNEMSDKL
jgi:hypothetical protein